MPTCTQTNAIRSTFWAIDAEDVITAVGGHWDEFADTNGARSIARSSILGRSLYRYIAGEETQALYRLLLNRVRTSFTSVSLELRCDSPDAKRDMRLEITPLRGGAIEFHTSFLHTDPRVRPRLFDPAEARSRIQLVSCSFCMRLQMPSGEWGEVDDCVARLDLLRCTEMPRIVHGVCADCSAKLRARADEAGLATRDGA